jgi:hypothetical protein
LYRGCFEAVLMKNTHGPLGVNVDKTQKFIGVVNQT